MACFCAELGELSVLGSYPDFYWGYSVRIQCGNLVHLAYLVHLEQSVHGEGPA